jgi:thioredoxin reductase (NADPH)
VTVLIRGASIAASMSDYLVQELDAAGVKVRCNTEVVGAGSETRLEHLDLRDRTTDETETVAADALFIFIGARPHTDWLAGPLALDDNGFVLTGRDLTEHGAERWPLDRPPAWLETSIPGVFAAGDIRHGSVKRVAAAVGEGSTAAMLVREYLASR